MNNTEWKRSDLNPLVLFHFSDGYAETMVPWNRDWKAIYLDDCSVKPLSHFKFRDGLQWHLSIRVCHSHTLLKSLPLIAALAMPERNNVPTLESEGVFGNRLSSRNRNVQVLQNGN